MGPDRHRPQPRQAPPHQLTHPTAEHPLGVVDHHNAAARHRLALERRLWGSSGPISAAPHVTSLARPPPRTSHRRRTRATTAASHFATPCRRTISLPTAARRTPMGRTRAHNVVQGKRSLAQPGRRRPPQARSRIHTQARRPYRCRTPRSLPQHPDHSDSLRHHGRTTATSRDGRTPPRSRASPLHRRPLRTTALERAALPSCHECG